MGTFIGASGALLRHIMWNTLFSPTETLELTGFSHASHTSYDIFCLNLQNQFYKMKWCNTAHIQDFQIQTLSSFFSLPTPCCDLCLLSSAHFLSPWWGLPVSICVLKVFVSGSLDLVVLALCSCLLYMLGPYLALWISLLGSGSLVPLPYRWLQCNIWTGFPAVVDPLWPVLVWLESCQLGYGCSACS